MYTTAAAPLQRTEISTFAPHCEPRKKNLVQRLFSHFSKEARSVRKGLKEVKKIESGKLKGKSFDAFLNEVQSHSHA